jgi:benzoyl-CoA 2,3-dioxygenase component B
MNEVTRAAYVRDCDVGVQRWNRLIAEAGRDFRFRLPSTRFHRAIGVWAGVSTEPEGHPISDEEWRQRQYQWLPSVEDRAFVQGLMQRVTEPGKVAGWLAPPEIGINNAPLDYEYVRLN